VRSKQQLFENIAQSFHRLSTPLWVFTPGPRWTWGVLVLSIGAIFLLDSVTPLGFVVWMLYLFPLWIAGGMSERHSSSFIFIIGGICAGLMLLGFWLSPPGIDPSIGFINRLIGMLAVGMTTWSVKQLMEQREVLHRSEAELRDFVEGAAIGLHGESPDGTILWANQAELDLLGYSREEYVGHHIREFHVDPLVVEHMLNALSAGHTLYNYEAKLLCKNGATRDVSIVANVSWKRGRFSHTRCFTRDITAFKEAERQLAHLAAIVKSTDDAVISFSPDTRILTWNKGAEKLLGWTETEALGQPKWLFVPAERHQESTVLIHSVVQGRVPKHIETQRLRKDGSLVDVSITVSPVLLKGRLLGACETIRDITARKRGEQALIEANQELEAFSYTVSHDLRAPLRSINGFVKILLEDHGPTLNDEARRCLGIIHKGAQRMGELIDDLLTFSRLSRSPIELRAVDPKGIINEAWLELRQDREGRKVEFIVNDLPHCRADRRLLKQVWVNLLSNALKYTRPQESARIEIGWSGEDQRSKEVVYWIRDNGVGFDQRYVHKLFGVFQRLHRAEDFEGTGVGLAIVQRIVKRHGGRVWAEGQVDQGATISMMLERVNEHEGVGVHLSPIG
jgi:PAS domain S-box-containing protein